MKLTPLFGSATFRLAVIYMLLFSGSVAILLGFIYWATVGVLSDQVDETIRADINGLSERYEREGSAGVAAIIAERIRRDPGGRTVYLLTDPLRQPLVGNISAWPRVAPDQDGWVVFDLTERDITDDSTYLARARSFLLSDGLNLLVGREVRELEKTRVTVINSMVWGIGMTLALALAGGIAMSRSTARKVEAINQTSKNIMEGDLALRIPIDGTNDEFDHLAKNLNAMLDQNQRLMEGIRHVSDNVAHDLRTPLTRLRGILEQTANAKYSEEHRKENLERAIQEADNLLSIFNALLRITKIEAESSKENFLPLKLETVARDVAELYEPVAQEKGIKINVIVGSSSNIVGDRDLLFQAIANLVDNAIKHAPPDTSITLSTSDKSVVVTDSGSGVPENQLEQIFRRFYRVDESRQTVGNGLGLALVKAVSILHRGRVLAENNNTGLKITLTLG